MYQVMDNSFDSSWTYPRQKMNPFHLRISALIECDLEFIRKKKKAGRDSWYGSCGLLTLTYSIVKSCLDNRVHFTPTTINSKIKWKFSVVGAWGLGGGGRWRFRSILLL